MSQVHLRLLCEVVKGGQTIQTLEFDQDLVKVGKLPSSHLWLDDTTVSRMHAVIERGVDGQFSVLDLGSASGTYVNGERITKAVIQHGDELQFGDILVLVQLAQHVAPAPVDTNQGQIAPSVSDATAEMDALVMEKTADMLSAPPAARQAEQALYENASNGEQDANAPTHVGAMTIQLDDGTEIEPYTVVGYYDESGNYIPGYYDDTGQFFYGYGYYDETGHWVVLQGYYDPQGQWIDTTDYESDDAQRADGSIVRAPRQSDKDLYTTTYFTNKGGDTLEVAFLFNDHILDIKSFSNIDKVTIGAEKGNDFVVEHAAIPEEQFPLVIQRDGAFYLTVTSEMQGVVSNADQQYYLQDVLNQSVAKSSPDIAGAYCIPIGANTSARIEFGSSTLLVRFTDTPAAIGGGIVFDKSPYPYLAISAAAHILLLILAMITPDEARRLELDGLDPNNRFVELLVKAEEPEELPKPDWLGGDEDAAKHKGEEGKAGREDSPQTDKHLAIEGDRDPRDVELRRAQDTEVAVSSGALNVLLSSEWGTTDTTIGSDALSALGNMSGSEPGESQGVGGLGLSGAGRGGDGVSETGIGMANIGTAGRGGGGKGGSGYGRDAGDLGDRSAGVPQLVPGRPAVTGALDREIIQRVVRQHRNEIRHCYEQELLRNRSLTGRINVRFTISPTGSVVSVVVADTTLNNVTVERCVAGRIQRWVFPEPQGGGIVTVTYPFNFSPS